MSLKKDTDYLGISARIRAMENRLINRERLEQMLEARDIPEAMKILVECGYPERKNLEDMLAGAQADVFHDMKKSVPEPKLVEIFQLKYDYHNAKTVVKARAMGVSPQRLFLPGGRYQGTALQGSWEKEGSVGSPVLRKAIDQAWSVLEETKDPQRSDLILDRAFYQEMGELARELGSSFLENYVRLLVDVANLRAAVRVARMGKESDFLKTVLIPGGSVSEQTILAQRGETLAEAFRSGALFHAAELGEKLAHPGAGALTQFEKACDDAVTAYLSAARRIPFGEETVIGYLYARELELTAVRTIFAGKAAGLEPDVIRQRLRETYG